MLRFFKWFKPRPKRCLFQYFDGYQTVYGDPIAISDRIEGDPELVIDTHIPLASMDDKRGREAHQLCVRAWRRAFQLKEFDPTTGKGLTDGEVSALYIKFIDFTELLKKSIEPMQTPPASTDATSSGSGAKTQNDTSDTNSTSPDKPSEESIESDEASSMESSPSLQAAHPT